MHHSLGSDVSSALISDFGCKLKRRHSWSLGYLNNHSMYGLVQDDIHNSSYFGEYIYLLRNRNKKILSFQWFPDWDQVQAQMKKNWSLIKEIAKNKYLTNIYIYTYIYIYIYMSKDRKGSCRNLYMRGHMVNNVAQTMERDMVNYLKRKRDLMVKLKCVAVFCSHLGSIVTWCALF